MGSTLPRASLYCLGHAAHLVLLLVPTLIFAGVGLADVGGFDWPIATFAGCVLTAAVVEGLSTRHPFRVQDANIEDNLAMHVAQAVGLFLLAIFWSAQIERRFVIVPPSVPVIGGGLLMLGIILRIAAIRTLGTQFISDIQVNGPTVRDGIYGWLNHPSELGLLLLATGGALLLGSPVTALFAGLILSPISLWRIRREDHALSQASTRSG